VSDLFGIPVRVSPHVPNCGFCGQAAWIEPKYGVPVCLYCHSGAAKPAHVKLILARSLEALGRVTDQWKNREAKS
jgi:hypothetical protein